MRSHSRILLPVRSVTIGVLSMALLLVAQTALAAKIGAMGDSLTDEYFESSPGAGISTYAATWLQQLVQYRGIDAGPTAAAAGQLGGTWGIPRRTGYEYNWARWGSDTALTLNNGQHTGLAAQIVPNGIDYAVLMNGSSNFFPGGTAYQNIYNGTWVINDANTTAYVNQRISDLTTALDTVLATGVPMVIVNVADYGVTPYGMANFPNASQRQLVTDVIDQLNVGLDALAQSRGIPIADLNGFARAIFGSNASPNTSLLVGNVAINLQAGDAGFNPTAAFIYDGRHPGMVAQGLLANLIIEALNEGYGANIALFSEQELLAHRGIAYGGSDTLAAQIGPYSDHVINYVPEPSALLLATCGAMGLFLAARFRSTNQARIVAVRLHR